VVVLLPPVADASADAITHGGLPADAVFDWDCDPADVVSVRSPLNERFTI